MRFIIPFLWGALVMCLVWYVYLSFIKKETVILLASGNPKKVAEIQEMAPKDIRVLCLKDIPWLRNILEPEENGETFLENAQIKAEYWARKVRILLWLGIIDAVLAEDSGLMIDALGGKPGVNTRRCIAELCPGQDVKVDAPHVLYPILLNRMEESGNPSTTAHWVSTMVCILPYGRRIEKEARFTGEMGECSFDGPSWGFDGYLHDPETKKSIAALKASDPERIRELNPRTAVLQYILFRL